MRTRPDELPGRRIADALRTAWGLTVDGVEYLPVGFGSHHWSATGADGRWFVTVDDLAARRRYDGEPIDRPLRALSAALSSARSLRDAGLAFVVAPRRTATGAVLHVLADRFAVALYPHVDGTPHPWGPYPNRDERLAVLDLLAALHGAPAAAYRDALVDDLAVPERDHLVAALADRDRPWPTGPFGERARELLGRHADRIRQALDRHDRLAAAVAAGSGPMVLTHGEPHRGNTITTAGGPVLVDWDTAMVAPPERDLWALAEEDDAVLDAYRARTGTTPDADALALYRLRWDLADIAVYVRDFRRPHGDTDDTRLAWRSLASYLEPARWREAR